MAFHCKLHLGVFCLYMFFKNFCLDGILFFVCWACVTCISLERRERYIHCKRLKKQIPIWKITLICLPSNSGGSSRSLVPSTLVFILIRSSLVKSPLQILFSIWPYSGSSFKWCSLSKMITALMQFSQCWLDNLRKGVQCLWHQRIQADGSLQQILLWIHQKVDFNFQFPSVSCQAF